MVDGALVVVVVVGIVATRGPFSTEAPVWSDTVVRVSSEVETTTVVVIDRGSSVSERQPVTARQIAVAKPTITVSRRADPVVIQPPSVAAGERDVG